jgi:hypothetical protein
MPAKRPRTGVPSSLSFFPARDPEVLDAHATARMLGISTHAVYALFKKGELTEAKYGTVSVKTEHLADELFPHFGRSQPSRGIGQN